MSHNLTRRGFLKKSVLASTCATLGLSLEEKALLASTTSKPIQAARGRATKELPLGKIGNLKISRLICGGNLVAGYAHARNLIYASELLKHYFTEDKILETLEIAEENAINSIVLNNLSCDFKAIRVLNRYWKERGGKIQWIAQCNPTPDDLETNIKIAIDHGAVGAFVQGGIGDEWTKSGRVGLLGKVVDFIKENGLAAGIGGHSLEVPKAVEKAGISPDFYFKTLNNVGYCSETPEETIEFMRKVEKPWIAYKVLGAGVTHPRKGFKYAFENGADFVCVGMFDFQVIEDAIITRDTLSKMRRERPWRA